MLRVKIIAIGRVKNAPEASLLNDYKARFDHLGRQLGFAPLIYHEIDDRKGGSCDAEAALLRKALPVGGVKIMLDERGKMLKSEDFAAQFAAWRDMAVGDLTFVIGGADGLAPSFRQEADMLLSFGKMVWPHMLVRVMLSEQLYRAASILGHLPYHRA